MIVEIRNMINLYGLNYVYNEKLFIQSAISTFLLRNGYDYTKFFIDEYNKDPVKALEYDNEFIIDKLEYFLKIFVIDVNYAYKCLLKRRLTKPKFTYYDYEYGAFKSKINKLKNLKDDDISFHTTKEMFYEACYDYINDKYKKMKKLKKLKSYNIFYNIIENELKNRIYCGTIS